MAARDRMLSTAHETQNGVPLRAICKAARIMSSRLALRRFPLLVCSRDLFASRSCASQNLTSSAVRAFSRTALNMAPAALHPSTFLSAIKSHDPQSPAVIHSESGKTFTYGGLLQDVAEAKSSLLSATGRKEQELAGERIAFLVENSYDYVGV